MYEVLCLFFSFTQFNLNLLQYLIIHCQNPNLSFAIFSTEEFDLLFSQRDVWNVGHHYAKSVSFSSSECHKWGIFWWARETAGCLWSQVDPLDTVRWRSEKLKSFWMSGMNEVRLQDVGPDNHIYLPLSTCPSRGRIVFSPLHSTDVKCRDRLLFSHSLPSMIILLVFIHWSTRDSTRQ